jgi:tubulin polyglutamylase TTLL11
MHELASKKSTGYFLNKMREYYPEYFDFFPPTFLLPEEIDELEEHMDAKLSKFYIAKPDNGS